MLAQLRQVHVMLLQFQEEDVFRALFRGRRPRNSSAPMGWGLRAQRFEDQKKERQRVCAPRGLAFDAAHRLVYAVAAKSLCDAGIGCAFANEQSAQRARGQSRPWRFQMTHCCVP